MVSAVAAGLWGLGDWPVEQVLGTLCNSMLVGSQVRFIPVFHLFSHGWGFAQVLHQLLVLQQAVDEDLNVVSFFERDLMKLQDKAPRVFRELHPEMLCFRAVRLRRRICDGWGDRRRALP